MIHAAGMALAFAYSAEQGLCPAEDAARVVAHLAATAVLSKRGFVRELVRAGFCVDRIVQRQVAAGRRRGRRRA